LYERVKVSWEVLTGSYLQNARGVIFGSDDDYFVNHSTLPCAQTIKMLSNYPLKSPPHDFPPPRLPHLLFCLNLLEIAASNLFLLLRDLQAFGIPPGADLRPQPTVFLLGYFFFDLMSSHGCSVTSSIPFEQIVSPSDDENNESSASNFSAEPFESSN